MTMAKQFIQNLINKFIPDLDVIRGHKNLQFLGDRLHDPNLWHLNRRSVAKAVAVGLFCAWIPTPMQMVFGAAGAIYFRSHIPISVALVWITNPITMPPLFYFAYRVGLYFLHLPTATFSLDALLSGGIWFPFLTGCLIVGSICALAGYIGIDSFWRYHVAKRWAARKEVRKHQPQAPKKDPFKPMN
jgi:uncharacterized protein (DUF2062 family)